MNKKSMLIVVGVLLVVSLITGISYAYWMMSHTQSNNNVVNSECFATTFTEVEDSAINIKNSYPMTNEAGMKTKPYEFTVTNTCDTYASFNINMEILSSTTLSHDLIKAVLDEGTPKVATNYKGTTATIEGADSYILLSGGLDKNELKTFNFRMWIDEAGTLENSQNKIISTKIVVITTASKRPPTLPESLITLLLNQYYDGADIGLIRDVEDSNLYYFKGTNEEVANNFLWYGGHQWRILEFDDSAKTITLISQQPLTSIQPASVVWTNEEEYNSSYINTWLNDYFYNSLDISIQNKIIESTFNIGDGNELTTVKKVGLLDRFQYDRAGKEDSFLDIKNCWWLGNRYSSSYVRYVSSYGRLSYSVSNMNGVRAVIKISDLTITSGDGTLSNNYRTNTKATNTNNIQVGEYINVPYKGSDNACGSDKECTMRVVSKDNDSIKVVLNGLLPTTSEYGSSTTISTSHTIYTNVLNPFIANIDAKYITTGTYNVGMYETGNSYTAPASTTITANVGLPTVGEMFSGNDIDMGSSKTFVDVSTIENSTASSNYWTMNRNASWSVRSVDYGGYLSNYSVSSTSGVRAVFYLKSGASALTFSGGEGTPQNPYTLN